MTSFEVLIVRPMKISKTISNNQFATISDCHQPPFRSLVSCFISLLKAKDMFIDYYYSSTEKYHWMYKDR